MLLTVLTLVDVAEARLMQEYTVLYHATRGSKFMVNSWYYTLTWDKTKRACVV